MADTTPVSLRTGVNAGFGMVVAAVLIVARLIARTKNSSPSLNIVLGIVGMVAALTHETLGPTIE